LKEREVRFKSAPLIIGLSARFYHPEPGQTGVFAKTLQYLEQSVAHWIMGHQVIVFMVPSIEAGSELRRDDISIRDYVQALDGLVLQGGADIAPDTYGEEPLAPEWAGDRIRDRYELELFRECVRQGKPVLGICRGCQLINVAFGGTLYQDITTQVPDSMQHVSQEKLDQHFHAMNFVLGSRLASLYPGITRTRINTLHHQAVKELGKDLAVEALSVPDGIIEAIRWKGTSFVFGVQWHPEFHDPQDGQLLDSTPLLLDFLAAARERAGKPVPRALSTAA
jgi:gamma-glutamyl-gamma-aminobutyrate hydrolase PuuD